MKANGQGAIQEMASAVASDAPKLGLLLTPEEAAELLRVPRSWIYQHVRRRSLDRIPFVKIGRYVRIRKVDLVNYINRRTVKA